MSQLKQDELRRKRVNELDQIDQSTIHEEDDMKDGKEGQKDQDREASSKNKQMKHPYLGSKIDLNG